MEDQRKNIREPFRPEDTPTPPQIIDPNRPQDQGERQEPVKAEHRSEQPSGENSDTDRSKQERPADDGKKKLLGESETEITDETTI